MAAVTTFASPPPFYANTSTALTTSAPYCMPCLWLALNPISATWPSMQGNNSILRTVRTIVDPNINSTWVSTYGCNTGAISQYNSEFRNAFYTVDSSCNLVASYYWGPSNSMVTLTLDTSTDRYFEVGDRVRAVGAYTTTVNGTAKCTTGGRLLSTTVGTYTGRTITASNPTVLIPAEPVTNDDQSILAPVTSYRTYTVGNSAAMNPTPIWILPELTDYLPDYPEVAQCTYVSPDPPPSVLRPASVLTEPPSTVPLSTTTSSGVPMTSATPGSSPGGGGVPSTSTTSRQTTSSTVQVSSTSRSAAQPIVTTSDETEPTDVPSSNAAPPVSSFPTASDTPISDPPASGTPSSSPPGSTPPTTADDDTPAPTPDTSSPGNGQPAPTPSTGPGIPPDTGSTAGQGPSSSRNSAISPVSSASTSNPPLGSFIATGIGLTNPSASDLPSISAISTNPSAVVIGGSVTISAGGLALTSAGNVISVLPSGSGVVVQSVQPSSSAVVVVGGSASLTDGEAATTISNVEFSVLPSGQGVQVISSGITTTLVGAATSIAGVQVSAALPQLSAVVIGESLTLAPDSPAATVSGVQFSLLPSGQGVQVVSAGSTTTIAAGSEMVVSGVEVSPVEPEAATTLVPSTASGFVLGGTTTLFAGGSAATVSGSVYSVLPADIVEVVSGTVTQYVIGGSSTLSPGSQATVFGIVYSALPSGDGVVVVVSSRATTVRATGTGGAIGATPSVEVYTGSASTYKGHRYAMMIAMMIGGACLDMI